MPEQIEREMMSVEQNVIYGMYSGLALLMDVYYPSQPNGYGIVYVPGSGWHSPLAYNAAPLNRHPQVKAYVQPLQDAGYTVFAVNHRVAPRFRYPTAVEDVQRAVRFIRHHAHEFGIHPEWIGAAGGSSGAYLVSMAALLNGQGEAKDPDPVNRETAHIQCVVARATPVDFLSIRTGAAAGASNLITDFMGMFPRQEYATSSLEYQTYFQASPINHVTPDAPPFLLVHGTDDKTVPIQNSELMFSALREKGVEVEFIRIEGAGHGYDFPGAINPPDYLNKIICWFDQHLPRKQAQFNEEAIQ